MLFVTGLAQAETIEVFSQKHGWHLTYETPEFKINPKLGRAWLEVTQVDDSDSEETYYDTFRTKVPGLSFNQTTQDIQVVRNGVTYICAQTEVRARRITGRLVRYIYNTGRCTFSQKTVIEIEDDGYHQRKVKRVKIYMHLQ